MNLRNKKLLFRIGAPLTILVLIMTSNEQVIPFITNPNIRKFLFCLSFPNTIIFNLCVGYLSGLFIYYLTAYLPKKERDRLNYIISSKLITHLLVQINELFNTLLEYSDEPRSSDRIINLETLKVICEKCKLNTPTKSSKVYPNDPNQFIIIIVAEKLLENWKSINNSLNEIDSAAIYIDPTIYDLCLKIRKSNLSYQIKVIPVLPKTQNLEGFNQAFHELFLLKQQIEKIQKK